MSAANFVLGGPAYILHRVALDCNQVDKLLTKIYTFVNADSFSMARITASISTRVDARGKSEILLRFVSGRDHIYRLRSNIFIHPSRFKDGAIVVPRLETEEQRELKESRTRLDDLCNFLLDAFDGAAKENVDRAWMQDAVERFHHPEADLSGASFFDSFDTFIRVKDVSPARIAKYNVVERSLRRFEQYRGRPLTIAGFDVRTLDAFTTFLAAEHDITEGKEEARGKNAIRDYHVVLRTFFHWCGKVGISENNPFRKYQITAAVYGTPYYLSLNELDTLYRADFGRREGLAVQRDIFVFQCLVGCRVGDLLRFTPENVRDWVLTYIPRKTKDGNPVTVRVPLNDQAREIVSRYEGETRMLLPFISAQRYNDAIKDAFRLAGLTRPVTILDPLTRSEVVRPLNEVASSHLARRTFIGNLYRIVRDPNIIASMSGHVEGSRAFARYRNIDDDIKADLVRLLEKTDKRM